MRVLFTTLFLVVFAFYSWLFSVSPMLDFDAWVKTADEFYRHDSRIFSEMTYAYPGTSLLMLTGAVHYAFPISVQRSMVFSLAFLSTLAVILCALIAYCLRPQTPWWLAVTGIGTFNVMYVLSTPPTAIILPFFVLAWLMAWYFYEQGFTFRRTIWLGVLLGFMMAVRIDISLATAVFLSFFFWREKDRYFLAVFWFAVLGSFFVLDPYLWFMPIRHIGDIVHKLLYHYTEYGVTRQTPFLSLLLRSPWAFLGFGIGLAALLPSFPERPLPRFVLSVWIFFTITLWAILWHSTYRAPWYFFVFLMFWESILPLFLLSWMKRVEWPIWKNVSSSIRQQRFTYIVASLFVVIYIIMILHFMSLPNTVFDLPSHL